jgi:hypothetical protein
VIIFRCPTCSQKYSVKDEFAEKHAICLKCQARMVVPRVAIAVPTAAQTSRPVPRKKTLVD